MLSLEVGFCVINHVSYDGIANGFGADILRIAAVP